MNDWDTPFTHHARVQYPIIGGPMFPCSNPELVAAVSAAGGLGIVQPLALTFIHGYDFRAGVRYIRSLTDKPIGMNALIEKSSRKYHRRMEQWVDIALEEGVRFFITSLGNPRWVVQRVGAAGGIVYHDVTNVRWAQKGLDAGVQGLIAVNARAGGHAGVRDADALFDELHGFGVPLICAGGVGDEREFARVLGLGYAGVQMGTRFIASAECKASDDYKNAIVAAHASDIVLTERITGIPVSVIRTPYVARVGTRVSSLLRLLLRFQKTKYLARAWLALRAGMRLKKSLHAARGREDYWQAGKSADTITRVEPVGDIVRRLVQAAR